MKTGRRYCTYFSATHSCHDFTLRVQSWQYATQDGIRQQIITIITEIAADTGKIVQTLVIVIYGMVVSHSPVDIHIYDGNGLRWSLQRWLDYEILTMGTMYLTSETCFSAQTEKYTIKLKATEQANLV